jgi:hypothetical protein
MEANAFIGEVIAGVILLTVGARVLKLASPTAQRPARLLGTYLVLAGISYAFYSIPLMFSVGSLFTPLTYAGRITYGVSVYFALEFTRSVFRSGEAWGHWLVYALMLGLVVGIGISSIQGDWEGMGTSSPWFWCEWLGYTLTPLWVAVEGMLAYASARKRVRLDLCDPIVANRYLLWSLFGVFQIFCSLVIVPMYAEYEADHHFTFGADALLGTFEVLAGATAWLAFFAPNSYRNWIARNAASARTVKGS